MFQELPAVRQTAAAKHPRSPPGPDRRVRNAENRGREGYDTSHPSYHHARPSCRVGSPAVTSRNRIPIHSPNFSLLRIFALPPRSRFGSKRARFTTHTQQSFPCRRSADRRAPAANQRRGADKHASLAPFFSLVREQHQRAPEPALCGTAAVGVVARPVVLLASEAQQQRASGGRACVRALCRARAHGCQS